jgi:hypothetical protein
MEIQINKGIRCIPLKTERFTFTMNVVDEGVRRRRTQGREEVQDLSTSSVAPLQFYTRTVYRCLPGSGPAKQRNKMILMEIPSTRRHVYGVEIFPYVRS